MGDISVNIGKNDMELLTELQKSSDTEISREASLEISKRIQWSSPPDFVKAYVRNSYYNSEHNYYICSFGGCGSKMLQAYLSNFGNTFHIHSRYPPKKLTRVGTADFPEWFNDIELTPTLDRQIPLNQIENTKVIYIYRDPIYASRSRIIPGKNYRISTDHLDNISADHWNIEAVIGNMMDLWGLEEFFDNYTKKDPEKNYPIYCVNYDTFWENLPLFNETLNIPDIPALYPKKIPSKYELVYEKELRELYKSLLEKISNLPPVFIN